MKAYFKQAWRLLKQNKVFSTVYIIGTGLAITVTMVLTMIFYIKIAPVYPEVNRNRMLVIENTALTYEYAPGKKGGMYGAFAPIFFRDYLYHLQTAELVAGSSITRTINLFLPTEEENSMEAKGYGTDANYWQMFSFRFLHGRPYTEEELKADRKVAVISQSAARRLFGDAEAVGKEIIVEMALVEFNYQVIGVVADVSYATPDTYAQIWIPNAELYKGTLGIGGLSEEWMGGRIGHCLSSCSFGLTYERCRCRSKRTRTTYQQRVGTDQRIRLYFGTFRRTFALLANGIARHVFAADGS